MLRYPAKFHPPVARALLRMYSKPGQRVLDPFCGSGTLLVEAMTMGRSAVGSDIDPIAVFASKVKTARPDPKALRKTAERVLHRVARWERSPAEYKRRMFQDIAPHLYARDLKAGRLSVPGIPNLLHWFRRYVVLDLARIRRAIRATHAPRAHKDFLLLCFASIIRGSSNADPVPVSGLEVTSHMRRRDEAGRLVNPFAMFRRTVRVNLDAVASFSDAVHAPVRRSVYRADATRLSGTITQRCDVVITSPPYHNAVDYYRRHTLEMYWLDFVLSQEDRLRLLPHYIGRCQVPNKHPFLKSHRLTPGLNTQWEARLRKVEPQRANAFKHYAVAMRTALRQIAAVLPPDGRAVLVVGNSTWNGASIPTAQLFEELAQGTFRVTAQYWYPLKNRYMSYARRNGANINREQVLVLKRVRRKRKSQPHHSM